MTADEFRGLALSLPEAVSAGHMGHPDFQIRGKKFAAIGADQKSAVIKLTVELQSAFVRCYPKVFQPANGAEGRRGYTAVQLAQANRLTILQALLAAWRQRAPKRLVRRYSSR